MKEIHFKALNTLLWVAVGFVICLLFWQPWQDEINLQPNYIKPVVQIVKETETKVIVSEVKADSFIKADKAKAKQIAALKNELYAVRKQLIIKITEPPIESVNGTSKDYEELKTIAINYDSACSEVVEQLNVQLDLKDSTIFHKSISNIALKKGFEEMTQNSLQKDAVIKSIHKKLKWQKLQNIGFKAIAITVAAIIIKNNL